MSEVPRPAYLLATRSGGKLRELKPLFERYRVQVADLREAGIPELPDEATVEAFETFEANARAKAEYFFSRSGIPSFADDSGLVVHALGGQPGVWSKRWSGRSELDGEALDAANNAKLVTELAAVHPEVPRTAEYVCAAAFTDERGTVIQLGRTPGVILPEGRGSSGFGYDPYFLSEELGVTFGEALTEAKNAISHRGRAFSALLAVLALGD